MDVDPNTVAKYAPGAIGSVSAAVIMAVRGNWRLGAALALPGSAFAFYGAGSVSAWAGLSEGLAGFLLGLLGMAAVVKLFDEWERFALGALLKRLAEKLLGLPQEPKSDAARPGDEERKP